MCRRCGETYRRGDVDVRGGRQRAVSLFRDDREVYACIGGLLRKVCDDSAFYDELADSGLVMRVRCVDPDAVITIDARAGVNEIRYGTYDDDVADVELRMTADVAHRVWLGQADIFTELMRGNIDIRGPLDKLARVRPLIKPARGFYPDHLREIGCAHLLESGDGPE